MILFFCCWITIGFRESALGTANNSKMHGFTFLLTTAMVVAALAFCCYHHPSQLALSWSHDTKCDPITEDLAWCGAGIIMPRRRICIPVSNEIARFRLQTTQASSLQGYHYNGAWIERGYTHAECAEKSSLKSGIAGGFRHVISLEYQVRGVPTFNPLNGELYYSKCATSPAVNVSLLTLATATTERPLLREACETWLLATSPHLTDWRKEEASRNQMDASNIVYRSAVADITVRCNFTL